MSGRRSCSFPMSSWKVIVIATSWPLEFVPMTTSAPIPTPMANASNIAQDRVQNQNPEVTFTFSWSIFHQVDGLLGRRPRPWLQMHQNRPGPLRWKCLFVNLWWSLWLAFVIHLDYGHAANIHALSWTVSPKLWEMIWKQTWDFELWIQKQHIT